MQEPVAHLSDCHFSILATVYDRRKNTEKQLVASGSRAVRVVVSVKKRRNQIKLLMWDRDGFAIWFKRLEKGTFELPVSKNGNEVSLPVEAWQLRLILEGVQLKSITRRSRYKKPEPVSI